MAPPMQYLTSELARALRTAPSMRAAAYLLGMSLGALRKRALKDRSLRPLALACVERGKLVNSPGRPRRSEL